MQILLSSTIAGPGRKVKQEQEEIFCNHVQTFSGDSVLGLASCFSSGRGVLYHATLKKVRYSDRQNFRVRCRSRAAWNPRIWMGRVQRTCAVPRACGLVPDKRRIVRTDDERSERAQTPTNRERLLCRAVIVRPADRPTDRPTTRRTANPLCTLMSSSCTQ